MMSTDESAQLTFAPILNALASMQSNVDRSQKAQAHEYLEAFQKSPEAWTATFGILQAADTAPEARLFAATTLKGKITYDLHQLPRDTLPQLRDTIITLLQSLGAGPKPIRTQLCVCLANLAIQMLEWKDVLPVLLNTLGSNPQSIPCMLEFLHVLPEEVTEGRKIHLTEEELDTRTGELLQDNAAEILNLLVQYSQSSDHAARDPQLLECITSWLREVPVNDVVNSPLLHTILDALDTENSFDSAVECLSAFFKETREVDEYLNTIQTLFPSVMALRPKIEAAARSDDADTMRGITRIFAEAGEAWVVLAARMPEQFRSLVEAVLECAARDKERDAISITFIFWYELKQYITLEKYMDARLQYVEIYSQLVDIMIGHLQFPKPDSGNEADLFDGDREQEEKFREFRHQMGDVLKDCCEVIGVSECLKKPYDLINAWVAAHGSLAHDGSVPDWQTLEAPLFSMRAMGRMVSPGENIMLPRLMPLLIDIPDHEKVRFQAVMALGRYTEWTANHPETLEPQLNFIMAAFNYPSKEVVRAAALSFKFFCNDCADLLKGFSGQIQPFYENVLPRLPTLSQDEVTDGVASVLAKLPLDQVYQYFKMYCDPVMNSLIAMAQNAGDERTQLKLADQVQLVTIFVQHIRPSLEPSQPNPAVQYCQEIFPILAQLVEAFPSFVPILERVCRCWRYMILSYRTAMSPLLPQLAEKLANGFTASKQGCFLWATASIVREFSAEAEHVDLSTSTAVYQFFEQQALTFLRALSDLMPEELPDVIEDFFRLCGDVLMYYPRELVSSQLVPSVLSAATTSLTLLKEEPIMSTLHFLRDLLAYGSDNAPSSSLTNPTAKNTAQTQQAVRALLAGTGEVLTQRVMTGMMYTFPRDCFPDASGVLLAMFQIMPQQVAGWVKATTDMLPPNSITPQESQRLMDNINRNVQAGEMRKIRTVLQDFTNSYRRRNVAPRDGLGRLEATRFKFSG